MYNRVDDLRFEKDSESRIDDVFFRCSERLPNIICYLLFSARPLYHVFFFVLFLFISTTENLFLDREQRLVPSTVDARHGLNCALSTATAKLTPLKNVVFIPLLHFQ